MITSFIIHYPEPKTSARNFSTSADASAFLSCYDPAMHIDLETLTEPELRAQLEKYMRLFDAAHGALLRLSAAQLDADAMRRQIADTLQVIDSYPDHPRFRAQ